jgi:dTDP-L-rhamnose 4-epimerase
MTAHRFDVIQPVLDEAAAIPWVLERMPSGAHPIVVDNGSTDGSGEIARSLGAEVVVEPRRGFGSACYAGLLAARADVIAFMDCDASLDPSYLVPVTEPVGENVADLVVAARAAERGAWPVHARLANRHLARRLSRRYGWSLTDLGPMRAVRRKRLLALGLRDRRSGWPLEMVLRAGSAGWRVVQLDVPYLARCGRSKVTGTVRGTVRAIRDQQRLLRDLD